jgi:hypothetical protein
MRVKDIFQIFDSNLDATKIKLHLATCAGESDPIDEFLSGSFNEWQSWQKSRNFSRPLVCSFIQYKRKDSYLFAGIYHVVDAPVWRETPWGELMYQYTLQDRAEFSPLSGRLIMHFKRPGRQPYLLAENYFDQMRVEEYLPRALSVCQFPGFRHIDLSRAQLELIFQNSELSWKSALSSIAGIYLITDVKTGSLYVGSAYGIGGIWQRWYCYFQNGHGGNRRMQELLIRETENHLVHFRYSVLEIADLHDSPESVIAREQHWKRLLGSRAFGLNFN